MFLRTDFSAVKLLAYIFATRTWSWASFNASCPPSVCSCWNCSATVHPSGLYHCGIKDVSFVPFLNTSRDFCTLDFSRGRITTVKQINFDKFTRVLNLTFSYNSIRKIEQADISPYLTGTKHLYLDHNRISSINKRAFYRLVSLEYLYLDYNELYIVRADMFSGLRYLRYLNLANNRLTSSKGTLYKQLPSLLHLNVEGNKNFTLQKRFLRNTTLLEITGGIISEDCQECKLIRNYGNVSTNSEFDLESDCKYVPEEHISTLLMTDDLEVIRFVGECKSKTCELNFASPPKVKEVYKDRCWEVVRKIKPIGYVLGSVATFLNTVALITIAASKSLFEKTSFLLIAHLALCDLLIGVYSILVATGHEITEDATFRSWRKTHCPYYRSLLVLGQTMGVFTSLLMTVERYLAIVHCMRPNLRLNPKLTITILVAFWPLGAGTCFVLQYFDTVNIRDNLMCVLVQSLEDADHKLLYSQAVIIFLVFLYLFVVGMYAHIYKFVRQSAISAGIHRETKLARVIGLIVFSNLIFFAIPNLSILVFTLGMLDVSRDPVTNTITRVWLPPICMVINSCLNPLLFAYRNDNFLNSLKRCGRKVSRKVLTLKCAKEVRSCNLNKEEKKYQMSQATLAESYEPQITLKSITKHS